jgi:hypothetical protein
MLNPISICCRPITVRLSILTSRSSSGFLAHTPPPIALIPLSPLVAQIAFRLPVPVGSLKRHASWDWSGASNALPHDDGLSFLFLPLHPTVRQRPELVQEHQGGFLESNDADVIELPCLAGIFRSLPRTSRRQRG